MRNSQPKERKHFSSCFQYQLYSLCISSSPGAEFAFWGRLFPFSPRGSRAELNVWFLYVTVFVFTVWLYRSKPRPSAATAIQLSRTGKRLSLPLWMDPAAQKNFCIPILGAAMRGSVHHPGPAQSPPAGAAAQESLAAPGSAGAGHCTQQQLLPCSPPWLRRQMLLHSPREAAQLHPCRFSRAIKTSRFLGVLREQVLWWAYMADSTEGWAGAP